MKITGVKQYYWKANHYVKVETDEGIYGFGEATLRVKQPIIADAIDMLGKRLEGMDIFSQEWILHKYFGYDRWRNGVIINSALAALDVAIWDAIGKKLGEPVCNLLGGKVREKVPVYSSGWTAGKSTRQELEERARQQKAMGFTAFKSDPMPWPPFTDSTRNRPTREMVDQGIENFWMWREILGDDAQIGCELHGRLDYDHALRFMQGIEKANPFFVEEPLLPDDVKGYAKLRDNTSVPMAAGERLFTRWGHRQMLEDRLLRVAQPDFAHCCGLCEAKKMAANAELFGVLIAPHNSNSTVSTLAAVHVDATIPNLFKQEFFIRHLDTDAQINLTPIRVEDGCISLENALPGIGFTPNFELLEQQKEPQSNNLDW